MRYINKMGLFIAVTASAALWLSGGHNKIEAVQSAAPMFIHTGDQYSVPANSPLRSQLAVQTVAVQQKGRVLPAPAIVEADPAHTVNILPPASGRIIALNVHLGDYVKKGEPLLVIASGDYAQALADVKNAADALQLNKRLLNRAQGVQAVGGNAAKDVEQAQSAYMLTLAEDQRARAKLFAFGGGKTAQLTLTAPISGYVTSLLAAAGAYLNDPAATIMTINNLDQVWFTASVPDNTISVIASGQLVDIAVTAYPGEIFRGKVAFVAAVLDPDTHSEKVRIGYENHNGKFKPNMFATVSFTIPVQRQVVVPNSALIMNNDSTTVFVEVAPWVFVRRVVETGYELDDVQLILKGLNPGDRVIVKGGVLIND
jgi:cobalt-zinc-cadmium efflux system membrane fusion protein